MIGKNRKKWLSLDSFMGKALCILLVFILTVGAFLAPKLINSLYDNRTLMQISYMDMNLNPYAVNYLTVEDKLQAIARVKTAGGSLSVLQAGEESYDTVDDEKLAEAVNQEIEALGSGINVFFSEAWWTALTEDDLVSKKKYTLYGRPEGGEEDTAREMAPFQFWVLEFARMDQDASTIVDKKGKDRYVEAYSEATDRLMVCMDADFYKLYAVSFAGSEERINAMYGDYLVEALGMNGYDGWNGITSEEWTEIRSDIIEALMDYWGSYWDTLSDNRMFYLDIESELVGAFLYQNAGTQESDATARTDRESERFVDWEARGLEQPVVERVEVTNASATDAAAVTVEENVRQSLWREDQTFLILSAQGQRIWGEGDAATATVVQKIGCRDFFEMMQF